MEFTATEAGFENGLGGASNAKSGAEYHYVLFGLQVDNQHSEYSGVYFEYDDQINGSVDSIARVRIGDGAVEFTQKDGSEIVVKRDMTQSKWDEFLTGIRSVFAMSIITNESHR